MTQAISTVFLDMDGTLLDLHFDDQVWNVALPQTLATTQGMSLTRAKEDIALRIGPLRGTLSWYCLDHWERELGVSIHALEIAQAALIKVRPGTEEFLRHLTCRGYRVVLATNAHPRSLDRKLAQTGLRPYFQQVVSAHEFGAAKEAPEFWHRLARLGDYDFASAMLVDDNGAVLETARGQGVRHVFGVHFPSSSGERKRYLRFASVNRLAELIPWLEAYQAQG